MLMMNVSLQAVPVSGFMVTIFLRLLGCVLFQLQHKPDLLVDALPVLMSRDTWKRLRDIYFPSSR